MQYTLYMHSTLNCDAFVREEEYKGPRTLCKTSECMNMLCTLICKKNLRGPCCKCVTFAWFIKESMKTHYVH